MSQFNLIAYEIYKRYINFDIIFWTELWQATSENIMEIYI
jgi:hypothetical protein